MDSPERAPRSRVCPKCLTSFSVCRDNFHKDIQKPDGFSYRCKWCLTADKKSNYLIRREDCLKKLRDGYYNINQEGRKASKEKYRLSEKGIAKQKELSDKRKAAGIRYYPKTAEQKLKANFRKRFCKIKQNKHLEFKTREIVGYDFKELRQRLELNFKPGMTWDNHGSVWHIDHKKPLSLFDYSDMNQVRNSWMLCNMQPLFVKENLVKNAKFELRRKLA